MGNQINVERYCLWGPYVVELLRTGLGLSPDQVHIGTGVHAHSHAKPRVLYTQSSKTTCAVHPQSCKTTCAVYTCAWHSGGTHGGVLSRKSGRPIRPGLRPSHAPPPPALTSGFYSCKKAGHMGRLLPHPAHTVATDVVCPPACLPVLVPQALGTLAGPWVQPCTKAAS